MKRKSSLAIATAGAVALGLAMSEGAGQKFQFDSPFWLIQPDGTPHLTEFPGLTVVKGRFNTKSGKLRATEKGSTTNQSNANVDLSNNTDVRTDIELEMGMELSLLVGQPLAVTLDKFKLKVKKNGKVNGHRGGTVIVQTM